MPNHNYDSEKGQGNPPVPLVVSVETDFRRDGTLSTVRPGKPGIPGDDAARVREAIVWLLENDTQYQIKKADGTTRGNFTKLGERLGLSQPAVSNLFHGHSDASDDTAGRVAELMGMSKEDLRKSGIFLSPRVNPPAPPRPPAIEQLIGSVWPTSTYEYEDGAIVRATVAHLRMDPPATSPGARELVRAMLDTARSMRLAGEECDAERLLLRLCEPTADPPPRRKSSPPLSKTATKRR